MRILLKTFALLDVLSIILIVPQIWVVINHFGTIDLETTSILKIVLTTLIFLSLFISAYGQFFFKKYGIIAYYVQFPFRLILYVFSIGFITFLPELFHQGDRWFGILFRLCVVAEFFRMYYTVQIHRAYFRPYVAPLADSNSKH